MRLLGGLIAAAEDAGIALRLEGEVVKVRYSKSRHPEVIHIIDELRSRRSEVIRELRQRGSEPHAAWPSANREALEKFGKPYALLFPLIDKLVWTPKGVGYLRQVLGEVVRVRLLDRSHTMTSFRPEEVFPHSPLTSKSLVS